MLLNFSANSSKQVVFEGVTEYLKQQNLPVDKIDDTRPWGGFFVLDEAEAEKFISFHFPELTREELSISGKLSPKI